MILIEGMELARFFGYTDRKKRMVGKPVKIGIKFDSQLNLLDAPSARFRCELHVFNEINDFANKAVLYEVLSYSLEGKFRRLFE